ncbi:hypothetical protein Poli38472_008258 [Pythium oligandrum]|uniref:Uncharacterized protein n=1 Tax=Pythium oligandrum TaxID=41045 RepID=A0A8K1CL38_PYTOL|nr:hypothetical protein Poli38472_008258 [Pythium oligandrum]|eukprot:TMW65616.1 hypothetical protein Poli38472_008258 [Pythium oligandrum]
MLLHLDATRIVNLKKGLSCPKCQTIMRSRSCLKKLPRQLNNTRKPVVTCPQCDEDVDARAEESPVNEALRQTIQTLYHLCESPQPVPAPSDGKSTKRRGQKRTRMIEDISTSEEGRGRRQRDAGYPLRSRSIATVEQEEQSQSEETETEEEEDSKPVRFCSGS